MFVKTKCHYAILLIFKIVLCGPLIEDAVIESGAGTIKGLRASDGNYFMYLGIPYAKIDPNNPFGVSISV